jgi:hypothetical protein
MLKMLLRKLLKIGRRVLAEEGEGVGHCRGAELVKKDETDEVEDLSSGNWEYHEVVDKEVVLSKFMKSDVRNHDVGCHF